MSALKKQKNMVGLPLQSQSEWREEVMRMRLVDGRWYTNFFYRGHKIETSLDAYEKESRKAQVNLGKIFRDMENGINPCSMRRKIKHLKIKKKLNVRNEQILRQHIYPFFDEYKPSEVNQELIESYLEHRWGQTQSGELQGVEVTFKKELGVLRMLIVPINPSFKLPKVEYKQIEKDILPPLTLEQVKRTGAFVAEEYRAIYWIMAYTAMDISDVVYLKPSDFKDGWIAKKRGKTKIDIKIPICKTLVDILKPIPTPINPEDPFFPNVDPRAVSKSIIRAFTRAGLEGYGLKYLRRFVASMLLDAGYGMDWVGKALAHSEGSKITQCYTKVYKEKLKEAFDRIDAKVVEGGI